ncbi:cell division protein FtsZ [Afifella sp. IM 167]|uniref:cell division protein FtsZ n=1 Tax=Afifella sp. IM 167 TaxID=2033586 RepID=UPI001CCB7B71|nr:cell division protein FtsZ [Afifella sp. IM 167]MBZ8135198.1 cell division protein FtsZ [Afifella sp. IM 167]
MGINLHMPDLTELKPRITVFGVGGAGCNAVNNMIEAGLKGVDFVVANTDAQALTMSRAERVVQMGVAATEGLGAGSQPEIGRAAAEETIDEINDHLSGAHMVFITAGMGGGTGTGAAPIVARAAREMGILTVGVVTKPFQFEGQRRMRLADAGISELTQHVDTLIVIPNQNLFRIANEKTTFADAFAMADEVLYSGVACITDLMVKDGLINLDFADVRSVMRSMGKAMMGTGEASGDKRAVEAAEKAIANPLLDEVSMRGAQGLLISITGGKDMTLFEVDEAASRVREEVESDANIIFGATFDESLEGVIRVSVVATGIDQAERSVENDNEERMQELTRRLKSVGGSGGQGGRPAQPAAHADVASFEEAMAQDLERELAMPRHAPVNGNQSVRTAPAPAGRQGGQPAPAARAGERQERAIKIGPFRPEPSLIAPREPESDMDVARDAPVRRQEAFVPPAAERPLSTQARMPKVEDFPAIAQRQIHASRDGHEAAPAGEDRRPRSLLARITHGLSKHAEGEDETAMRQQRGMEVEPRMEQAPAERAPARPSVAETFGRPQQRRTQETAARGGLDPHGRPAPASAHNEDDQLEIPAFLRRQTS